MRIEQFEYLIDIEKTRSITQTAENFFISRQVVSANIRAMETELGVQLLIRQQGNLKFTTLGEIAVEKARAIVSSYQDFLASVSPLSELTDTNSLPSISIFSIPRLASTMITDALFQYRKKNPETDIRMITQSSKEVLASISTVNNAIGFISYPDHVNCNMEPFQLAQFPDLTIHPLFASKFYICLHKNSRYNTKQTFTNRDLASLPLLSFTPAYEILSNFSEFPLNIVSNINDLSTLQSLIQEDFGIGLITLNEFNRLLRDSDDLILRPIQSDSNSNIYYAYVLNEESAQNPYINDFIRSLRSK